VSEPDRAIGLEPENSEGRTEFVGKDPRTIGRDTLTALGHKKLSILQVIRAKCIDCCAGQTAEVRKCTAVFCPNWPFRMGFDPWRERRQLTPERRAQLAETLAKARKR
jgi:hypothetical protein